MSFSRRYGSRTELSRVDRQSYCGKCLLMVMSSSAESVPNFIKRSADSMSASLLQTLTFRAVA